MPASAHTTKQLTKPKLSFTQIFNMSFGFLGIQFGFALQNSNASGILRNYGADVDKLSWFLAGSAGCRHYCSAYCWALQR